MKNILQALEKTSIKYADKIAFGDSKREVTYQQFVENSKSIGSYISNTIDITKSPIVIFIDKTVNCLETMMGVLYSGNFYSILDTNSPKERAESIIETLNPVAIITDSKNKSKLDKLELNNIKILHYDEMLGNIDENRLLKIREKQIDTDPMYVLFTSGSTGVPKGTVVSHKSVIEYSTWVKNTFDINQNTIWGSQTPFYFSMSITDVFSTIITGATLYVIPKMFFSFPVKLIEFLNEKKINSIYWVPSALCIVANLGALKDLEMPYMKKILFAGEVMPTKQLNMWRKALPKCLYANLYGPTETTDICSYYVVNKDFKDDESIPIGTNCDNCGLIILKEDGTEAKQKINKQTGELGESEQGELLVRGSFLASGYYNNKEKSNQVFIQNPVNTCYSETVYKTGDIVKYNKDGELIYLSRKDYQIKHMGYRIELGEIERNMYGIKDVVLCCSVYDDKNQKIVLFYQGNIDENELAKEAEGKLLPYMRPNVYVKMDNMPYNSNGKIDRKKLKESIMEE